MSSTHRLTETTFWSSLDGYERYQWIMFQKRLGKSQDEIARAAGVSKQRISQIILKLPAPLRLSWEPSAWLQAAKKRDARNKELTRIWIERAVANFAAAMGLEPVKHDR